MLVPWMRLSLLLAPAALVPLAVAACAAEVTDPPASLDDGCVQVTDRTRLARLTHRQYDRTVQDLLYLPADVQPSETFLADPRFSGFDNNADRLTVSGRLALDYRSAAEAVAARLVADDVAYGRLVPCEDASGCPTRFVDDLGRRAYRRPLTADERSRLLDLFADAFDPSSPDAFRAAVGLVVEGVLQSPKFLYRTELTNAPDPDTGLVPLDPYEVASRLSYMLWNTMPDDALFAAAAAGELGTGAEVRAQAERMLADPKATNVIADFHAQWLATDKWTSLVRDPARYPENVPGLVESMRGESDRFVQHVVFDEAGGLRDLLTRSTTFVDGNLASIYGVDAPAAGFSRVELDPAERAGVFTQVGFLAWHGYYDEPSPIHRGVFIQRRLLCADIPPPPSNADLTLPAISPDLPTNRARTEAHTSASACSRCHGFINPTGFAFEGYDALGRTRAEDNGQPVDAAVEVPVGTADPIVADGAVDFVQALADRPEPYRCYVTQWLRYAYGRPEVDADRCLVDRLAERAYEDDAPVTAIVADLAANAAVRYRPVTPPEETAP